MKKFLVMLMVVAMASFLFVGCMPGGVAPDVDEEEDEDEVPAPASTTPVIEKIINVADADDEDAEGIISLYSSKTQYMNESEIEDGILISGFAPKYSDIQVYVDGAVVGTGVSYGVYEGFTVFVAKADLGVDGAKTLYVTAKEGGLDESDPSTAYAFTLDVVAPEIVSVAAEVEGLTIDSKGTLTVTCSEAIDEDSLDDSIEDSTNIWSVTMFVTDGFVSGLMGASLPEYDLISPKVIELSGAIDTVVIEGRLIRVAYEASEAPTPQESDFEYTFITDLAGNELVESVHYCFLEVED